MLPLVDRPLLAYTFEHLRRYGVSASSRAATCRRRSRSTSAPRTAGSGSSTRSSRSRSAPAARSASPRRARQPFLALNGDSLRETDLERPHRVPPRAAAPRDDPAHPVEDPARVRARGSTATGACRASSRSRVRRRSTPNLINAGMYVLEPDVLDLIPRGPDRLDRARGLPAAGRGAGRHGIALAGYWLDIGTPEAICRPIATCSSGTSPLSSASARRRLHARSTRRRGQPGRAARCRLSFRRGRDRSEPAPASAASQ